MSAIGNDNGVDLDDSLGNPRTRQVGPNNNLDNHRVLEHSTNNISSDAPERTHDGSGSLSEPQSGTDLVACNDNGVWVDLGDDDYSNGLPMRSPLYPERFGWPAPATKTINGSGFWDPFGWW